MRSRRRALLTTTLAGFVAVGGTYAAAQTASNSPRERFTAIAVNISNVGRTGATPLDIVIERWTTDEERDQLMAVFKELGPEKLLSALQKTKRVGSISTPGSLAYDLHYAREMPDPEGGRRIILATDRPMAFWEASNRPRTVDYPFTLIEMHVNKQGQGQGKLNIAAKLILNDNVLVIEDYANQPVMLNDIKKTK
jgi:hypothetical protein